MSVVSEEVRTGPLVEVIGETDRAGAGRRSRWTAWLAPTSPIPIVVGVVIMLAGFGLIAFSWSQIAGLLNVALQFPYLVSGGLTGLGLVIVGALIVNVSAKRQDAAERARQLEQLSTVLSELRSAVDDEPRRR